LNDVADAWTSFAEAWFPNAEETVLPPKFTSSMALMAVVAAMIKPRMDFLREKSASLKEKPRPSAAAKANGKHPPESQPSAPLFGLQNSEEMFSDLQ
jgi:hypothetical protein